MGHTGRVRDWTVAGAVIEGPDGVLLVQNRRRNGRHDWSPPGGVIDGGESVLDGLAREVTEETGLVVTRWEGPIYGVVAVAADMDWHLRVEVYRALEYEGELAVDDPDGIVVDARFMPLAECHDRLSEGHPWVREPLVEWLAERWVESRVFQYEVAGVFPGELRVERVLDA